MTIASTGRARGCREQWRPPPAAPASTSTRGWSVRSAASAQPGTEVTHTSEPGWEGDWRGTAGRHERPPGLSDLLELLQVAPGAGASRRASPGCRPPSPACRRHLRVRNQEGSSRTPSSAAAATASALRTSPARPSRCRSRWRRRSRSGAGYRPPSGRGAHPHPVAVGDVEPLRERDRRVLRDAVGLETSAAARRGCVERNSRPSLGPSRARCRLACAQRDADGPGPPQSSAGVSMSRPPPMPAFAQNRSTGPKSVSVCNQVPHLLSRATLQLVGSSPEARSMRRDAQAPSKSMSDTPRGRRGELLGERASDAGRRARDHRGLSSSSMLSSWGRAAACRWSGAARDRGARGASASG